MKRIGFISLGCSKNLVDTEHMLADLMSEGYEIVADTGNCDIVVINTCGFIESAKMEAIENILEMEALKKEGRISSIIVTGCLAERYRDEIMTEFPSVDAVLGAGSYGDIASAVKSAEKNQTYTSFKPQSDNAIIGERVMTTPSHTTYLRIADGCSNRCSYCMIPLIRGDFRSAPMEDIIAEAERLARNGVVELNVVAQDITSYGFDLYGECRLPELLQRLAQIDGIRWIRPLYCYPDKITDELIEVIANNDKIAKYIDIPIQHSDGEVLRRMNRHGNSEDLLKLINDLRSRIPQVAIRTTIIVGFPGESEEQFSNLCEFVKQARFDKLGVFAYSDEEGSASSTMDGKIDEDVKARRVEIIMEIQSEISRINNEKCIGKTVTVLVEGFDEFAECYFGRTEFDAPDIDGKVFFDSSEPMAIGSFVKIKIDEALEYDLFGKLCKA